MKIRGSDIGLAIAVCAVAVATWVGCSRGKTEVKETPKTRKGMAYGVWGFRWAVMEK